MWEKENKVRQYILPIGYTVVMTLCVPLHMMLLECALLAGSGNAESSSWLGLSRGADLSNGGRCAGNTERGPILPGIPAKGHKVLREWDADSEIWNGPVFYHQLCGHSHDCAGGGTGCVCGK